jgi:hypothetical protein
MSAVAPLLHPKYVRSNELGEEITELFGFITAATYELLVKIREFDQAGLWELEGICSCAHWLNWKCGIGMSAGREKVRVANALGDLPKVSESFRLGEISYSKVRAITRVAQAGNEEFLLRIAKNGTAHHVETLVSGYRRAKRLNDDEIDEGQLERRELDYRWDDDGSLVINGRLPGDVGAMLMRALDSAIEHADQSRQENDDGDVTAETRPPVYQRRADALAEMAESYLATGPATSSSADRYQVMVHVTAETLTSDVTAETSDREISHLEDGPHVTAETSRRICCDASITKLVEDEGGELLSIGRKTRVIPSAMRRALKARDKHCRFPGCTHKHFVDGHHIKLWARGGDTSLDNLVQLCRHHYRLIHEGGFGCEKDHQGKTIFRNDLGQVISESGHMPPLTGNVVIDLKKKLEDRHIHSQTCVTGWEGEQMDRHLAVGMLCDLDEDQSHPGT